MDIPLLVIFSGIALSEPVTAVPAPIVDRSQCNSKEHFVSKLDASDFCAGSLQDTEDSCLLEGGGPLMCLTDGRWELKGILNYQSICKTGFGHHPSVFTSVPANKKWIEKVMGTRPNPIPGSEVTGSPSSDVTPTPEQANSEVTSEAGNEEPVVEAVKNEESVKNVDVTTPATEEAVKIEVESSANGEAAPKDETSGETTSSPMVESTSGAVSNMEVITNMDVTSNVAVSEESAAENGQHNRDQDTLNELKSEHESTNEPIVQEPQAATPNGPLVKEVKSEIPEEPLVQEVKSEEASPSPISEFSPVTTTSSVESDSPKAVSEDVSTAAPLDTSSASEITPEAVKEEVTPDTPIIPQGESQVVENQASSTTESTESEHQETAQEVTPGKPTSEEVPVINMEDVMNAEVPSTLVPLVDPSGKLGVESEGKNPTASEPQVSPMIEERQEPVVEEQKLASPTTEELSHVETSSPLTEEAKNVNEGLAPVSSEVSSSEVPATSNDKPEESSSVEGGRNLASFIAENIPAADPEVSRSEGDASEQNVASIGLTPVEKTPEQDASKAVEESSPKPEESEVVKSEEQRSEAPAVGAENAGDVSSSPAVPVESTPAETVASADASSSPVPSSEVPSSTPVEEVKSEISSQTPSLVNVDPVEPVKLDPSNDLAKLVSDEVSSDNAPKDVSDSVPTGNEAVQSIDAPSTPEATIPSDQLGTSEAPAKEKSSSPEEAKSAEEVRTVEEPKAEEPKIEDTIASSAVMNAESSTPESPESSSPKGFLVMSPIVEESSPSVSDATSPAVSEVSPSEIPKSEDAPVSEAEAIKDVVLHDISTPENAPLNPEESLREEINKWVESGNDVESSDEITPKNGPSEIIASSEIPSDIEQPAQDAIPAESFLAPKGTPTALDSSRLSPEIVEAAGPGLSSSENVAEGSLVPVVPEDATSF